MPAPASRHNPFEFGGELKASSLIDREQELDLVIRTIENGGKLFLIGPRRYGKTSILAAAEEKLGDSSVAVLRYDAEVYESLGHLAEALLAGAAKKLTPTLEKAGEAIRRLASKLKPQLAPEYRQMMSKDKQIEMYMQPPYFIETVKKEAGSGKEELSDAERADQEKAELKSPKTSDRKSVVQGKS